MLGDALFFPKARDRWLKTVGIGGLLFATSVLIIPYFVLMGYLVRVIRSGVREGSQSPLFEEWFDLVVDGVRLFVIQVIYGIVGLGIPAAIVVFTVPELLQLSQTLDTSIALSIAERAVLVFAYLFAFFVTYVSFAAFARFAHEDRFEAAFELRAVFRTAFTSDFFVAWMLAFAVPLIFGTVGALLALVVVNLFSLFYAAVALVLGTISALLALVVVGLFSLFYTTVAAYYLIGRGYSVGHKP